jgi:hypothetical protein
LGKKGAQLVLACDDLERHSKRNRIIGSHQRVGIAKVDFMLTVRYFGVHGFDDNAK